MRVLFRELGHTMSEIAAIRHPEISMPVAKRASSKPPLGSRLIQELTRPRKRAGARMSLRAIRDLHQAPDRALVKSQVFSVCLR